MAAEAAERKEPKKEQRPREDQAEQLRRMFAVDVFA